MPTPADNHYARLGVPRDASSQEVRDAYHEAARRLHPDVNPDPSAMDVFLQIQEAYETLRDQAKRLEYDATLPQEDDASSAVAVSSIFSRTTLARIDEPQLIYLLLDVMARPSEELNTSPPLNVCLVLDRSTSMQGLRLDSLKTTAKELIRNLRPQDYLAIVTFSDHADVLVPATRGSDYSKIEARISLLHADGSTEIFQGLKAGFFEVSRNIGPSYINHLILITDGRTYGDEEKCLKLADQARDKGVTISALGIGTEWNDAFMDDLTGRTGGGSQFVSSADDLRTFLEEKFTGLGKVFAERLSLNFIQDPGVELKYAFRLEPEPGPLSLSKPMVLGNLPRDEKLSLLMEFLVVSVPSEAKIVNLARGDIRLDIPLQMIPASKIPLVLTRPTNPSIDPEPPPQKIVKALSKLTLYRMQEQARTDLENGDIEQATRRLQNLATHLLSQGEKKLARTVLAEAERIQHGQPLSEQGEKRIKYGTRALLLPQSLEDTVG